jgi:hypothetical protein
LIIMLGNTNQRRLATLVAVGYGLFEPPVLEQQK